MAETQTRAAKRRLEDQHNSAGPAPHDIMYLKIMTTLVEKERETEYRIEKFVASGE